jgi:hypothetical protein
VPEAIRGALRLLGAATIGALMMFVGALIHALLWADERRARRARLKEWREAPDDL